MTEWMAFIWTLTVTFVPMLTPSFCQPEKLLPPADAGAVKLTEVPLKYERLKDVVPLLAPALSAGDTVIGTPVAGFVESILS